MNIDIDTLTQEQELTLTDLVKEPKNPKVEDSCHKTDPADQRGEYQISGAEARSNA